MTIHALLVSGGDAYGNPEDLPRGFSDVECAFDSLWVPHGNIRYLSNEKGSDRLPTKEAMARIVWEDAARMSRGDAYALVISGHGSATEDGESYLGLHASEYISPADLERILEPMSGRHQLLVTSACRDYGFGALANRRRTILTACSTTKACTQGLLSSPGRSAFFSALAEGSTYEQAHLRALARTTPLVESPPALLEEKLFSRYPDVNPRESLASLHGPQSVLRRRLISHAPMEIRTRFWKQRLTAAYARVRSRARVPQRAA